MEINEKIAEYYDELYPVSAELKKFFDEESAQFQKPVKYLRIGCGNGSFELQLSKEGSDVTGIETSPELLESANRKRRNQLMAVRFFQMSTLEMSRYLGKGFYNIISILDDRLIFVHDRTLMAKFFYDCRQLLSENGKLIISIPNFSKYKTGNFSLPNRESIRVRLFSKIKASVDGKPLLFQTLETGNGKMLSVTSDAPVNLITSAEIEELAKNSGFSSVTLYSDFNRTAFESKSDRLVAVLC